MARARRLPLALALAGALHGCSGGEERTAALPADSAARAAPPSPPVPGPARSGAEVERGVCPFECCTYGEWLALEEVEARGAPSADAPAVFRLAPGERFTARTGEVHLDPVGLAVAHDTLELEGVGGGPLRLAPGDTVEVLSPLGEGHYRMRLRGRTGQGPGFWEVPHTDPARPAGTLLRPPRYEWWVRVESAAGREGWLAMHALRGEVWGADACSGPPPA